MGNKENLKQLAAMIAYDIASNARRRCPVDTGTMRRSIKVKEVTEGFEVSVGVDYAEYVEYMFGTVENPKTTWKAKDKRGGTGTTTIPFFRPAINDTIQKIARGQL